MGSTSRRMTPAPSVGSNAGNLLAADPRPQRSRALLFCAHMDTVPLTAPVEPVRRDGGWENANEGILGADNKAAVAAMHRAGAAARRRTQPRPEVGVELLFTVAEETGLNGARQFDVGRLSSRLRLRLRSRLAARRDHHRLADAHAHRCRDPRQGGPRRAAARAGRQRDRRGGTRDREHAPGTFRRRDDGQRRHCLPAAPPPTSFPTAARSAPRCAPSSRSRSTAT